MMCPDEAGLLRLLSGSAPEGEVEEWRGHLVACAFCRAKAAATKEALDPVGPIGTGSTPSPKAKASVQNYLERRFARRGERDGIRSFWFWISLAAWASSFLFARYFLQFLFLAVLTGAKWIIDERKPKNHLMLIQPGAGSTSANPEPKNRLGVLE